MVPTPMPTLDSITDMLDTHTLTMVSTTARGLLRLSLRPMLRLTPTTTVPTDLATTDLATEPMDMELTPMLTMVSTTARGLLRLSLRPRLRLIPPSSTRPMAMLATPMPTLDSITDMLDITLATLMLTTARGPLMLSLSQRLMLMLTTGTTAMPGPTGTGTDTAATGATTGDKFSVLRSTKQKLKANITP